MARIAALLLALLLGAAGASAQAKPPAGTPLTATDVEAWMDGFMPFALRRADIPGAVVVVVKDGHVLFEKGYGLADVATGKPVDPRATLFRVGSISKLFTWTTVMQLVEQHRIDLDADVNRYLDFRVPPRAGRPVTMRELMTHTAGFEEATRGIATQDPSDTTSLGAALARRVPARVFDPGTTPAYSNYGAALAGYIVERVSHERFADYVAHHVLSPLGMARSTFVQPLPPALAPGMAAGYVEGSGPPQPFEQVVWSPAGGLSITGDDMARFMIAHLDDGRLGGATILRPETARTMHAPALAVMPPLDQMALGFIGLDVNGRRVIGHDGATVAFHATMALYLDEHVGLFVAVNAMGRDGANRPLLKGVFQGFSDRYFPGPPPTLVRVDRPTALAHGRLFENAYATTRRPFSTFLAGAFLLGQFGVRVQDDGTIVVDGLDSLSGAPKRFRETARFLWSEVGGSDRLAVRLEGGRIMAFAHDEDPTELYQAIAPARSARLLLPLSGAALLVILVTVLVWPIAALVRRRYGVRLTLTHRQVAARRLTRTFGVVALAAAAGWAWVLSLLAPPNGIFLLDHHMVGIHLVQLLSIVGLPGGVLVALFAFAIALRSPSPWWSRGWTGLVVFAFAALTWAAWVGQLLSFGTDY
ncbi:serine hydrolase domain-containing protein [Sphingomonas bacterium]|uniref:serine hydrolase domain-containing protein n=1 Tax=Sphingomonas bacterium TaxID=1895847 RepID=UPI0015752324|nr:serine hydrolase domain-containing protein [Sphingomonas bacterium]